MNKYVTSVKCCPEDLAVPPQYSCLWPKILREYRCLQQRHCKMITKNEHILRLAIPKYQFQKYQKPCLCIKNTKRQIEIVHGDQRQPTRTVQLAYPTVRQFTALKRSPYYRRLSQIQRDAINRNHRLSRLSLYSYLSNSPIYCIEKEREPPLSKRQKAKLMERLNELAQPNIVPDPGPPDRGKTGEMSMARLKRLATPTKYPPGHEKELWKLTRAAKNYVATEAIIRMAKPVIKVDEQNKPDYDKVEPSALKYKATQRIKDMAQPKEHLEVDANFKKDPFAISPKALKAKISPRMKELAEPKEFEESHIRENPFAISPKALKAKCTPRLAELAKPKTYV